MRSKVICQEESGPRRSSGGCFGNVWLKDTNGRARVCMCGYMHRCVCEAFVSGRVCECVCVARNAKLCNHSLAFMGELLHKSRGAVWCTFHSFSVPF